MSPPWWLCAHPSHQLHPNTFEQIPHPAAGPQICRELAERRWGSSRHCPWPVPPGDRRWLPSPCGHTVCQMVLLGGGVCPTKSASPPPWPPGYPSFHNLFPLCRRQSKFTGLVTGAEGGTFWGLCFLVEEEARLSLRVGEGMLLG